MAFNTNTGRAEYTASAGQTEFTYVFKTFNTSDLKVYLTPDGNTPDDTSDLLTETTHYTVAQNGDNGGTVTLVSAASLNDTIVIVRELPIDRSVDYQQGGDLLESVLDADQNYQTYLAQQNAQIQNRFIKFSETTVGVDPVIPSPAPGYFKWKDDGTGIELDTTIADAEVNAAAASAAEAAASATAAASSATAAATSATNSANSATSSANSATAAAASALEAASYVGQANTIQPTLTGNASVTEEADLVVTISNYNDFSSEAVWTNPITSSGSAVRVGNTITVTAGTVTADEAGHTVTITAQEPSHAESNPGSHTFTVLNIAIVADTAVTDTLDTDVLNDGF